jgi:hypothetical protein
MKFDLEKEADMHVRLYLDAAVRDQAFIKTGHEYGYEVVLKVPTRRLSVRARRELLRMRPDTSRPSYLTRNKPADETIDLGFRPIAVCTTSHDCTPTETPPDPPDPSETEQPAESESESETETETSFIPSWGAPFVPTKPQEWNKLILQFAEYRRCTLQSHLNDLLNTLRAQLEQLQTAQQEEDTGQHFRVEAYYVGLEGYEEAKHLVAQIDHLRRKRFDAWVAWMNEQLATFDPAHPPDPVEEIKMQLFLRFSEYEQANKLVAELNARIQACHEQA